MSWRLGNSIGLKSKTGLTLKKLNDSEEMNRAWENIQEKFKNSSKESTGPYELKHHKQWINEECFRFLEQDKRVQMQ